MKKKSTFITTALIATLIAVISFANSDDNNNNDEGEYNQCDAGNLFCQSRERQTSKWRAHRKSYIPVDSEPASHPQSNVCRLSTKCNVSHTEKMRNGAAKLSVVGPLRARAHSRPSFLFDAFFFSKHTKFTWKGQKVSAYTRMQCFGDRPCMHTMHSDATRTRPSRLNTRPTRLSQRSINVPQL